MYQSIEYEIDLHFTAYEKLFFKRESFRGMPVNGVGLWVDEILAEIY